MALRRLRLSPRSAEGVAQPMWHTLDRPMETPPDKFPDCPNINWIKLGELETRRIVSLVMPMCSIASELKEITGGTIGKSRAVDP